jgi:hypothetical protein
MPLIAYFPRVALAISPMPTAIAAAPAASHAGLEAAFLPARLNERIALRF